MLTYLGKRDRNRSVGLKRNDVGKDFINILLRECVFRTPAVSVAKFQLSWSPVVRVSLWFILWRLLAFKEIYDIFYSALTVLV